MVMPADDRGDAALAMQNRSGAYMFLSRLYLKELDRETLAELCARRYPVETGNADADEGYRLIAGYLSNVQDDSVTELAADYVRCFLGSGMNATSAAYPYESVYRSEKRLLLQDSRDEVLAIYRSEGLDKSGEWKDAEDHMALELEFMGQMCARTAQAFEKGDGDEAERLLQVQRAFFSDHLASWASMFTADMRKFAKTGLYIGLAYLTDGFLQVDRQFLLEA